MHKTIAAIDKIRANLPNSSGNKNLTKTNNAYKYNNVLRQKLKKIGDSLIVAGSKDRIHVHIHSNKPAQVFSMCERFGDVDEQKADDMFQQQQLLDTKNIKIGSI